MNNSGIQKLSVRNQKKLDSFKEYAVWHPQLAKVDKELMRAIREPAGFTHILVYGPSGVGKTTMMRQITQRLNRMSSPITPPSVTSSQDNLSPLPLLLLETRPPDGGAFNRADYYRTALKLLGKPFYERRMLVNIDSEQVWEKKGRGRTKAAQFNDSPELRHALEEAMSVSELVNIRLDDVDFERCQIRINSGKGGKDRIVPFPVSFKEVLAMHVDRMHQQQATYLFESSWKRKYSDRGIRKILAKYAEDAGLSKPISPHQLRHFLLTWLKKQGIDDALIQPYSGHSSRQSLEVYSRLSIGEAQEIYDQVMVKFPV